MPLTGLTESDYVCKINSSISWLVPLVPLLRCLLYFHPLAKFVTATVQGEGQFTAGMEKEAKTGRPGLLSSPRPPVSMMGPQGSVWRPRRRVPGLGKKCRVVHTYCTELSANSELPRCFLLYCGI